ncbi:hypothetical protein [Streptomyces prunicolor]|uniref:hypothetical protein n=1 Tax=Streptomyces prunicolor TaxID=67348 RepID=UPI0034160AEB
MTENLPAPASGDNLPAPSGSGDSLPAPASGGGLAATASGAVGAIADAAVMAVQYTVMLAKLAAAAIALRNVGARVRETYAYVGDCARNVDHLADIAASLRPAVDPATLGEHRQAANTMRGSLARACRMADTVDTISATFDAARQAHQADYGPVAEQAQAMTVPMANRNFYRSR